MREDLLIQRMREAIRKQGQRPAAEQIQDLIDSGVIDEKGNVLLRMPEPPPTRKKRTSKRRSRKSKGD